MGVALRHWIRSWFPIPAYRDQRSRQVVFVRKRTVEVRYLRATITDQQRHEFYFKVSNENYSGLYVGECGS